MNAREILAYYAARNGAIVDQIREIVDIESPSHNAGRSRDVASWVVQQARSVGVDVSVETIEVGDGVHLVIRAFPGDAPHTMLLGHTDTVHPIDTRLANPTRIEGDRFYGCGIFDMKSGIVLMLEVLRFFAETGNAPSTPLTIVLSCDEEVGSFTGRPLVECEAAGAARCLVFEPSADGRVKTGRKGTGMFALEAHGVPAHAGLEPEKGANAITEISLQVPRVHAIARPEVGTTVNVTTISGGTTLNVIPEYAKCEIDVRFSTLAEGDRVKTGLRQLANIDPRVSLELTGDINRPPMERTEEVVALYTSARELAAGFDYELGDAQVGGGSDGNFVAALGVPVLDGLGITGAGAHTLSEHILVSDIPQRATLITSLLLSA